VAQWLRSAALPLPYLSYRHFDSPWAGNEGGADAEKLVNVLPS
jgi:hypothetical protein